MAPDIRKVGQVEDIDGLRITLRTQGDRVRLEVGASTALLDEARAEVFAGLFISACWQAGEQVPGA